MDIIIYILFVPIGIALWGLALWVVFEVLSFIYKQVRHHGCRHCPYMWENGKFLG